ncbi:MAG: alanine racemase [bacterium]|nr:alanine racemase [bacterium]
MIDLSFPNRTWAEIDLDAAEKNLELIKKHAKNRKLISVIKADAYGHGVKELSRLYEHRGVDIFAVTNLDEAIQLRNFGIKIPILILEYTPPQLCSKLCEYDLIQTVFSPEYAAKLSQNAADLSKKINVHIKIDSGMGRIGFNCRSSLDVDDCVQQIVQSCNCKHLNITGIFTHFAVADEKNSDSSEYTQAQYCRFDTVVKELTAKGFVFETVHCSNSAGIFSKNADWGNAIRAGIVLYGLSPSKDLNIPQLTPVMSLKTTVSMVKTLNEGECVSYGLTYRASAPVKVATLTIGYADGYPRALSNKGRVLIDGKFAPIIGRICMNQMLVDVTNVDNVCEGTIATVAGEEKGKQITFDEIADLANTINYEIVCSVSPHIPRIYIKKTHNGKDC